jgi:uroporphyrinogen-III synthase
MSSPSFGNRRVLALESRRAREIESLISTFGGRATVAPAVKELPLESDDPALAMCDGIVRGEFDAVVFLTGVGVRALVEAVDRAGRRDELVEALKRTRVVVRGPKPSAALRDLQVPVWANAPEPNTWRELLEAIDAKSAEWTLSGARVAVQEYGVPNPELLAALRERGAHVTAVPTYQWAMPDDLAPLREAAAAVAAGQIDVLVITSGIQLVHFVRVARDMGIEDAVTRALSTMLIASIGPSASAEIRRHGLEPSFEPTHPKMGLLIREAAERFSPAAT